MQASLIEPREQPSSSTNRRRVCSESRVSRFKRRDEQSSTRTSPSTTSSSAPSSIITSLSYSFHHVYIRSSTLRDSNVPARCSLTDTLPFLAMSAHSITIIEYKISISAAEMAEYRGCRFDQPKDCHHCRSDITIDIARDR